MAIEEEFFIEIPDAEADEIRTVQDGQYSLLVWAQLDTEGEEELCARCADGARATGCWACSRSKRGPHRVQDGPADPCSCFSAFRPAFSRQLHRQRESHHACQTLVRSISLR